MGLSVLIAIGEKACRDDLVSGMDWADLGYTNIRATGDGERALDLTDLIRPDLVLMGGGMLRLDGPELEEHIRLRCPACRFLTLPERQEVLFPPEERRWISEQVRAITGIDPRIPFFRGPEGSLSPLKPEVFVQSRKDLRELGAKIRERQRAAAEEDLALLFDRIAQCESTSPDYIRHFCCQLVLLFLNTADDLKSQEVKEQGNQLLYRVAPTADLTQLRAGVMELCSMYFEAAAINGTDPVSVVNRYLQQNYTNPNLTAQSIADVMGFTSSYLCLIYRRRTGRTINQRLTNIRLEIGKDLLEHTLDRLCEIAVKCGYTDTKYFTKVFSRELGISPRRYRERYRQQQWEQSVASMAT